MPTFTLQLIFRHLRLSRGSGSRIRFGATPGAAESTGLVETDLKAGREVGLVIIAHMAKRLARRSRWIGVHSITPLLIHMRTERNCSAKRCAWNLSLTVERGCMITVNFISLYPGG